MRRAQNPAIYVAGLLIGLWVFLFLYKVLTIPNQLAKYRSSTSLPTTNNYTKQLLNNSQNSLENQSNQVKASNSKITGLVFNNNCVEIYNLALFPSNSRLTINLNGKKAKSSVKIYKEKEIINTLNNITLRASIFNIDKIAISVPSNSYITIVGDGKGIIYEGKTIVYKGDFSNVTIYIRQGGKLVIEPAFPSNPFEENTLKIKSLTVYQVKEKVITEMPSNNVKYLYYSPILGRPYLYGKNCEIEINGNYYTSNEEMIPIHLETGTNEIVVNGNCTIIFEKERNDLEISFPSAFAQLNIDLDFNGELRLCVENQCKEFTYNVYNYLWKLNENATTIKLIPDRDTYIHYAKICIK